MRGMLDQILESTRRRVNSLKQTGDANELIVRALERRRDSRSHALAASLRATGSLNIIAEFKRASPSKGTINDRSAIDDVARLYEQGGACAVSVLTEPEFFKGSIDDLRRVRQSVSVPVLRKDFILDELQVYEAAEAGADAVLLLVNALDAEELRGLRRLGEDELGMDALVEVHTREEMKIATEIGATLIGVNNRDLKTFAVSLDVSREMVKHAPPGATLVAESGLRSREDLVELSSLGYSGFLIGETLMRSDDAEAVLRELVGSTAS